MIQWEYNKIEKEKTDEKIIDYPFHLKISYFFIEKWDDIRMYENASLYLFYIIEGRGYLDDIEWKEGQLLLCPYKPNGLQLCTKEDSRIICIHNYPLLESMGVKPYRSLFEAKILDKNIESENVKKIIIPSQSKQCIKRKKEYFLISISESYKKVFSLLNDIEKIHWNNGMMVLLEKNDIIVIENQDIMEHYFLIIE